MSERLKLTRAQRRVLQALADDIDIDLAYEAGGGWWIGNDQTSGKLAMALLRLALISEQSPSDDRFQRYTINGSGRRALAGLKPYQDGNGRLYDTIEDLMANQSKP